MGKVCTVSIGMEYRAYNEIVSGGMSLKCWMSASNMETLTWDMNTKLSITLRKRDLRYDKQQMGPSINYVYT